VSRNHSLESRQQMSAGAYVERARGWARELEEDLAKGRSLEWARYELEQRTGLPPHLFWALRHRPPKRIATDIFCRLRMAYLDHCSRVLGQVQQNLMEANSAFDADLLAEAQALDAELVAKRQRD
jgi:hypothetical protein